MQIKLAPVIGDNTPATAQIKFDLRKLMRVLQIFSKEFLECLVMAVILPVCIIVSHLKKLPVKI